MTVSMVALFFPIAMAVTVVTLFFPISAMAVTTAAVSMMAVAGGMTRRRHRHHQQNDRSHNVQNGDVKKCRFDTIRVKQIASDERGSSGQGKPGEREHPQRAGYHPLSNGVQGSRGQDRLVAEQENP